MPVAQWIEPPNIRGDIVEVFHIQSIDEGILQGDKYIVTPSEEL